MRPAGVEPATLGLEVRCSIQLSYGRGIHWPEDVSAGREVNTRPHPFPRVRVPLFLAMMMTGVLWDMDGTLVDTEPYWIETEFELVRRHGNGGWSELHAHALVGMDLRDAARYMREHGELDLAERAIIDLLLEGVVGRVQQQVPWRPGARELLAELGAAGIPSALVTMSWRRFTDAILPALPEESFRAVVTGDDVRQGKPHPEPYLMGAARLGLSPEHCLAIEDSPTGARSAMAAGCVVLAVPNVIEVPEAMSHHRLSTLEGVRPQDLDALYRSTRGLASAS
jgi:HAD superfamily hydrolase (TIGR01509 family)